VNTLKRLKLGLHSLDPDLYFIGPIVAELGNFGLVRLTTLNGTRCKLYPRRWSSLIIGGLLRNFKRHRFFKHVRKK